MKEYSVIIPVYNEEGTLALLFESIKNTMETLNGDWEAIFVNDHSTDNSLQALKRIDSQGEHFVIIDFKKHYGKSASLQAGFDHALGKTIITMDADLQNDPEDIPKLLEKLKEGFDVVCGWRHERSDPWLKVWSAKIACAVRRIICRENIHDVGSAFRAFKKECLQDVYLSKGLHRFFTLIMLKSGYTLGEVKVRHHKRTFGKTKYNIRNRLFEGIKDLLRLTFFDMRAVMNQRLMYEIREIIRK